MRVELALTKKRDFVVYPLKEGPLFTSRNKFIFASSRAFFLLFTSGRLIEILARLSEGGVKGADRVDVHSWRRSRCSVLA